MPEPNEKMDALLKASAKRRQEEAGAPLEPHPATRQMLQAEVSRTYPGTQDEEKLAPGVFLILWPRLIFGGAFLAALVAVFFLVLSPKSTRVELTQNLRSPQAKEDLLLELRESSNDPLAKNIPVPSLQLDVQKEEEIMARSAVPLLAGDAAVMKLPLSKSVAESLAKEDLLDRTTDKNKTDVPAESRQQKGGELLAQSGTAGRLPGNTTEKQRLREATLDAVKTSPGAPGNAPAGKGQIVSRALGETVSSNPPMALAMKRKSEPVPSAAPEPRPENPRAVGAPSRSDNTALFSIAVSPTNEFGRVEELKARPGGAGRFVQIDSRARYRRNFLSPPVPKVLTAFNLERDGNKIRITDADGSVYDGEIELSNATTPPLATAQKPAVNSGLGLDGGSQISPEETVAFRVSGINKTLQQSVVFAGVMESAQIPKPEAKAFGGAGVRDENDARKKDLDAFTFGLRTSSPAVSIRGKASIGGTNDFPLEAVHEAP